MHSVVSTMPAIEAAVSLADAFGFDDCTATEAQEKKGPAMNQ
jgi:hypothetical protein